MDKVYGRASAAEPGILFLFNESPLHEEVLERDGPGSKEVTREVVVPGCGRVSAVRVIRLV